ncbi:MAG: VTT domain-containing protein [bacterium]|nr:VTT domain-containing protein [bacterium]
MRFRKLLVGGWLLIVCVALYVRFFYPEFFRNELEGAFNVSIYFGYALFLILGCVRGFTLIPSTTLIILGFFFFPPLPLFLLTMAGIIVSSWFVYHFSNRIYLHEYFDRKHPTQVARAKQLLEKHQMLILIGWSFFMLLPTDLLAYVCGTMRVRVSRFILGVAIGEGLVCGIYIFLGRQLLTYLGFGL